MKTIDITQVRQPAVIKINNIFLDKGTETKRPNFKGSFYLAILEETLTYDKWYAERRGDLIQKYGDIYILGLDEWLQMVEQYEANGGDWEDNDLFIKIIEMETGWCVFSYDTKLAPDFDYLCYDDKKRQIRRNDLLDALLD